MKEQNIVCGCRKWLPRILLAICLVVSAVLSGCGNEQASPAGSDATTVPYEEEFTGYEVKTPVGKICYPERWMDAIDVKQDTVDGTYVAEFYGKLENEDVQLFTLYVGSEGKGYLMGTKDDKQVWMDIQVAEPAENWSEAEAKQISEMQECVNDVMYQIYGLEGFVKSQPET